MCFNPVTSLSGELLMPAFAWRVAQNRGPLIRTWCGHVRRKGAEVPLVIGRGVGRGLRVVEVFELVFCSLKGNHINI